MTGRRCLPAIRQATATECGLACVAMIAVYHGMAIDLAMLRRDFAVSLKGATLESIANIARRLGLATRAVSCDLRELKTLQLPCVLHWRFQHFVVLQSIKRDYLIIHDPARGVIRCQWQEVDASFTGIALEISSCQRIVQRKPPLALTLRGLMTFSANIRSKFLAGLVLALLCELCVLVAPLYLQLVIDQVVGKGDSGLLETLFAASLLLLLLHVAANAVRLFTFQFLSQVTMFDIAARIMRRLMRLPMRFFRSRDLGDIQHRVQSMRRVQTFIVHSIPALILDVVFVLLICSLMMMYDSMLTVILLFLILLWCVWRTLIYPLSRRFMTDVAHCEARVQTHFLESLRAMQSIKAVNGEDARESTWRNHFASLLNARIRLGNVRIVDSLLGQALFQGARISIVYVLARSALNGQFTVGMLSAYVAYLGMFTARARSIVDRVVEYRLLDVPMERLADIVFSEAEPRAGASRVDELGDICIEAVTFAYSPHERPTLLDCNARFPDRSFTAIAGVSGSGKSTLLQLLAGNEAALRGSVTMHGVHVRDIDIQQLRAATGSVLQGDVLIQGSVADNIALFAEHTDRNRIRECAQLACIAHEISAFPMQYETLIGDLGSSLSRGQVQRILLARAFYAEPQLLLLDEATSGLDATLEQRVIDNLAAMRCTRVVITHSDRILAAADQVLWLHKGQLSEYRPDS